jgi:hypothetical protein
MAQKTKRKRERKSRSRSRRRIRRRSNETETETETKPVTETGSSPILNLLRQIQEQGQGQGQGQGRREEQLQKPPIAEKHHFYSKMFFDGNTMTTESQKDNEPVKRRKYTLKQLEREIPIGAELVKTHLRRKVPPAVNEPFPKDIEFTSVLPNPIDLGLMPPSMSRDDHHDPHDHTRDSMKTSRKRSKHRHRDNEENIKLLVNELS